jgi:uncharacterized protein DUF397
MSDYTIDPGGVEVGQFRVSSHSNPDEGTCVAVAELADGGRLVRHSRGGPVVAFTAAEWAAFTAGVRDGEFD